jgi:flagellar basal-body rod protein FlgB
MFQSDAFNYINILDKAADAGYLRAQAISNNIANATTPNYKRQDLAFESVLEQALSGGSPRQTLDQRIKKIKLDELEPVPYVDNEGYSYRLDGNNVDPETEGVMASENQIKYAGLIEAINTDFKALGIVIK